MARKVATNTPVERDELVAFLRPRHRAIVMTTKRDGSPQASPVTMGVDGDGRIVVSTYPDRAKAHNARRSPSGSILVLSDDWDPWVQVWGNFDVLDMPDALDGLIDYYRCISGEHPNWDEYRAAMVSQDKSLMRLSIERWGPIATGGFPARLADE